MKNIKSVLLSIFTPLTLAFILLFLAASLVMAPLYAMAEVVNHAKESTSSFFNSLNNALLFRGWCTDNDCYEKEEKDFILRAKELYNQYEAKPYSVHLKMGLIQATIFYANDYEKILNSNAVDLTNDEEKQNAGKYDYRAAKNQIYDLINHMVSEDKNGTYYIDIPKYDDYLRTTYIKANYPQLLEDMSIEQIIDDIHARAGYFSPDYEQVSDTITGDILDMIDAPYRGTECGVTSGFTSQRGAKAHYAVDVVGRTDKNIYSVADGVVVGINTYTENLVSHWDPQRKICNCGGTSCPNGYGSYIVIEHTLNGQKYRSRYAHLSSILITEGQYVSKGQQIAVEGSTGCSTGSHLHFEFYSVDGHKFDPTSIMSRCATQNATIANCNLEKLTVKVTECTQAFATSATPVKYEVPFKEYVMGVFIPEISPSSYNMEFMKGFSIVVQTYSLKRGGYDADSPYLYLRGCSNDQNYRPFSSTTKAAQDRIKEAVDATFGQIIMKNKKIILASYRSGKRDGFACNQNGGYVCQVEGNEMGKAGTSYMDILNYYYSPGIEVVNFCQNAANQVLPGVNNSKSNIACGAKNVNDLENELKKLNSKVETANNGSIFTPSGNPNGSRASVVAAARYLALDFPYKIPYYTSEDSYKGRYYKVGLNTDSKNGWGCLLTKEGIPTIDQVTGETYPNGLSDSGFVTWAFKNGGVEVTDLDAYDLSNLGQRVYFGDSKITDGTVKIGDLFYDEAHVGIVIGIDNNNIYVAEEKDASSGLVVTTYSKTETKENYMYILMSNVYTKEGAIANMW